MNQKRIQDYGIKIGRLPSGPRNKITDVAGVQVGHSTIHEGNHHTGVTVILLSFSAMAFSFLTSLDVPRWISYFLFGLCGCYLLVFFVLSRWLQRKM